MSLYSSIPVVEEELTLRDGQIHIEYSNPENYTPGVLLLWKQRIVLPEMEQVNHAFMIIAPSGTVLFQPLQPLAKWPAGPSRVWPIHTPDAVPQDGRLREITVPLETVPIYMLDYFKRTLLVAARDSPDHPYVVEQVVTGNDAFRFFDIPYGTPGRSVRLLFFFHLTDTIEGYPYNDGRPAAGDDVDDHTSWTNFRLLNLYLMDVADPPSPPNE